VEFNLRNYNRRRREELRQRHNGPNMSSSLTSVSSSSSSSGQDADHSSQRGPKVHFPTFQGGGKDRGRAGTFIDDFEAALGLNKVLTSSTEAVQWFRLSLKDTAKQWYQGSVHDTFAEDLKQWKVTLVDAQRRSKDDSKSDPEVIALEKKINNCPIENYIKLKELFLKRFVDKNDQSCAMMDIMTVKLSDFDSVTEFHEMMEDLFSRVEGGISESSKLEKWITNCDVEGFKAHIWERTPVDYMDAYHYAKNKETAMKLEGVWRPYREPPTNSRPGPRGNTYNSSRNRNNVNAIMPFDNSSNNNNYSQQSNHGHQQSMQPFRDPRERDRQATLLDSVDSKLNAISDSFAKTTAVLTEAITKLTMTLNRQSRRNGGDRDGDRPPSSTPSRSSPYTPRDTKDMTCYTCNKKGHISSNCPDKKTPSRSGKVNSVQEEYYSDEDQGQGKYSGDSEDEIIIGNNTNLIDIKWRSESISSITSTPSSVPSSREETDEKIVKTKSSPLYMPASITHQGKPISQVKVIVDTGSGISIVSLDVLKRSELVSTILPQMMPLTNEFNPSLTGASVGSELQKSGMIRLSLRVGSIAFKPITFMVVSNLANDIILGNDELCNPQLFGNVNVGQKTIDYMGGGRRQVIPLQLIGGDQPSISKSVRTKVKVIQVGALTLTDDTRIPPRGQVLVNAKEEAHIQGLRTFTKMSDNDPQTSVLVSRPHANLSSSSLSIINVVCDTDNVKFMIHNDSDKAVRIQRKTPIAMIEAVWGVDSSNVNTIMAQLQRHDDKKEKERKMDH
jgi:hypothetical protein